MPDSSDNNIRRWMSELPEDSRHLVESMYSQLTPEQRESSTRFLRQAEAHLGLKDTKRLLELVREQYAPAFAGPRRVCIVGPVNSGKSSLYNALLTTKNNRATVSPIPGTTKDVQEGLAGILLIIDTPGADDTEIGREGEQAGARRRQIALQAARAGDFLIMVFDASTGITRGALAVYEELRALGKPYVVALNKIDLVRNEEAQIIDLASRALELDRQHIVPTSATKGVNLNRLVLAVARANPELLATLGMLLPQFRSLLAGQQIRNAAGVAGSINLVTSPIPVPFISFLPITAVQAGLVLSLARLYGLRMSPERARELVVTLGAGFGARTLFQQLVTKIPGPGWALGTAIAVATTFGVGYSAQLWFSRGRKPSPERMRRIVDEISQQIVANLRRFGRKKPSKEDLSSDIENTLGAIVLSDDA